MNTTCVATNTFGKEANTTHLGINVIHADANTSYNFMKNQSKALLALLLLGMSTTFTQAADIWVSPKGDDANPGTAAQPVKTLIIALRKGSELRRTNKLQPNEPVNILLKGGIYSSEEPLFIRPEDSGTPTSPTVIQAVKGEKPVISGGVSVTHWEKAGNVAELPTEAQGKVWVAKAPRVGGRLLEFRQLWVNDKKAVRAQTPEWQQMNRIIRWDKKKAQCWIPTPKYGKWEDTKQLEMIIHQWWEIAILRVKSVEIHGDSTCLSFYEPESRVQNEHPWPAPFMSKKDGNSPFYLVNSIRFLNTPGEWYEDLEKGLVYYYPREGENMHKAEIIAPNLENIVNIKGTPDRQVSNIQFKGIAFEHAAWMRPSRAGHVPLQAGMYMLDAYNIEKEKGTDERPDLTNLAWLGRPTAGVTVMNANNISFNRCVFQHMAFAGLDFVRGTSYDTVEGCVFRDMGGNGLQIGLFSDEAYETHRAYNPQDMRDVCQYERIANNYVTDCANEDWGCVGIGAGHVRNINIEHNEVYDVYYTGISMGWQWNKRLNCMRNNRVFANLVHHYAKQMYDVAGIYTLSPQPGSEIYENCVYDLVKAPYPHDPKHCFYLYTDEGSSYIRVHDNWTEVAKFLQNANGPGNEWTNNGPDVSVEIKNRAGITPEYQDIK